MAIAVRRARQCGPGAPKRDPGKPGPEHGAILVIFAITIISLLVIAALVIDVGFAYATSHQDQTVADMSALAAARHLPGDPATACTAGWDYVTANLTDLPAGTGSPCTGFPSSCDSSTTAADYTATASSPYTIIFRYPVPAGDSLLSTARPMDGTDQCERFGVTVKHTDPTFFSGVAGVGPLRPTVQAVARHWTGGPTNVANLVSLDPIGCTGIAVNGASNSQTTTKVVVDTYTVGGKTYPGAVAVDSDGTDSSCNGGSATIEAKGGSELYAENTSSTPLGQISLFGLPGDQATCVLPACDPSQVSSDIAPQPISSARRVTRAPADHAYNCKSSYPLYDGIVSIEGCDTSDPNNGGPYIDELTSLVRSYTASNLPPGYTLLNNCTQHSTVTFTGNYWVECPSGQGFSVGSSGTKVAFQGNVIFDGSINVSGGAELDFGGDPSGSIGASCEQTVCLDASSSAASFVYLNGSFSPTSSNFTLNFTNTFLYVTAASASIDQDPSNFGCANESKANSVTSNSGTENWIGPADGPFKNLALWSESGDGNNASGGSTSASFGLHGGGDTTVGGVFFTPCAQFAISGGFTNPQTAQFLTFQLSVSGGSVLEMTPDPNKMLKTSPTGAELIR